MNESETRAEYIDPKLKAKGWGETEESKVLRDLIMNIWLNQCNSTFIYKEM